MKRSKKSKKGPNKISESRLSHQRGTGLKIHEIYNFSTFSWCWLRQKENVFVRMENCPVVIVENFQNVPMEMPLTSALLNCLTHFLNVPKIDKIVHWNCLDKKKLMNKDSESLKIQNLLSHFKLLEIQTDWFLVLLMTCLPNVFLKTVHHLT